MVARAFKFPELELDDDELGDDEEPEHLPLF